MDRMTKEQKEELLKDLPSERTLYPSQVNTKTISCRISSADYVSFLQDAISKGITLNDWLLMKIYSTNIGKVPKNEDKGDLLEVYKFLREQDFYERWQISEQESDWDGITLESPKGIISLIQSMINNQDELLKFQNFILEKNKKIDPNLNDVKAQILTIAQSKIKGQKNLKEFMFDVNELLDELV
jgi:hypothetical protein